MKIISVNAGSSSLKFKLFEMPNEVEITSGLVERIGNQNATFLIKVDGKKIKSDEIYIKDHTKAVELVLDALLKHGIVKSFDEIKGVGHRVVQGGEVFKDSVLLSDLEVKKIGDLSDLAPLHNPAHIMGILGFQEILPKTPMVAVFDTVFHSTMKEDAFMYATPYKWYQDYGIRKYGAHGTSHMYVSHRCMELLNKKDAKIVVCHIGNGASLCAVDSGISVDTSMGLTPLEGIPMGTRSGNIDPTVFEMLQKKESKGISEILSDLNKKSGYLGVSSKSHDSRDIEDLIEQGDKRALLAYQIQVKRVCDYIGSYYVYMSGLDAICFTAGIGENSSLFREMVLERLKVLGVVLDKKINNGVRGKETLLTKPESKVKAYLIPTDEELVIARETVRLSN